MKKLSIPKKRTLAAPGKGQLRNQLVMIAVADGHLRDNSNLERKNGYLERDSANLERVNCYLEGIILPSGEG